MTETSLPAVLFILGSLVAAPAPDAGVPVSWFSEAGACWLFASFCAATYGFAARVVPETMGKTLEEVEAMWGDRDTLARAVASAK
jgi:hypothetical protein